MSVLQRTIRMFVLAAMAVAGPVAFSQNGYHPNAEPVHFDPDWQFFAPVQLQDMEDLTARQRANKGFFFTYDRMYLGVTRPDTETSSNALDFTWGNRFDAGWMKDNEKGWTFSTMHMSGPNIYNQYEQRLANAPIVPIVPGPGVDERLETIKDSVNVGSFFSFDANKTWRLEPYRYGGILEPMIGMRYVRFEDVAQNDQYQLSTSVGFPEIAATVALERITRDVALTNNHMLLGQFGFRYTKFVRRWTFSNDAKVFAGHVYQNQSNSTQSINTFYGSPIVAGGAILQTRTDATYFGRKNNENTVGFDIRVEGAYKATKHVDLRAGFEMLYFGRGVWRGATNLGQGNQFSNDQHLIMPGFTFGLTLNR